jgi:hypothetical protein
MTNKVTYLITFLLLNSCSKLDLIPPIGFETTIDSDSIVFANIGDYGSEGIAEQKVADMVKSWNPDFILTNGDNNYSEGKLNTIRQNISQYYGDYIYNFDAPSEYQCKGNAFTDSINRFFPCPGNHDSNNDNDLVPYRNFFTLPGNELYYKFIWGPVTFFSLNSLSDIDNQRIWLNQQIATVTTPFIIVLFHYPPYSAGDHGSTGFMQWDFESMNVDVVLSGHDHIYNRFQKKDEPHVYYIVNGLGGRGLSKSYPSSFSSDLFTTFCYSEDYGAIKITATRKKLILEFFAIHSSALPIDRIEIVK